VSECWTSEERRPRKGALRALLGRTLGKQWPGHCESAICPLLLAPCKWHPKRCPFIAIVHIGETNICNRCYTFQWIALICLPPNRTPFGVPYRPRQTMQLFAMIWTITSYKKSLSLSLTLRLFLQLNSRWNMITMFDLVAIQNVNPICILALVDSLIGLSI